MANAKVSDLTPYTVVHNDDLLMVVDVHDITMTSSGTSKKATWSQILAASNISSVPAGMLKGASGTFTVAVPGTDYLLPSGSGASLTGIIATQIGSVPAGVLKGSSGAFAAAVSGTDYLLPSGSGASLTGIKANQIGSVPAGIVYGSGGAFSGGANWTIGSSGQITGTAISDPGSPNIGDLWISNSQNVLSFLDSGVVTRSGGVIWQALGPGPVVANTTSLLSVLAGVSPTLGSLTIPANALVPGKILKPVLFGTAAATGTPTLTVQLTLGGTIISSVVMNATAFGNSYWSLEPSLGGGWQVQSTGASGKIIGMQRFSSVLGSLALGTTTGTNPPALVTINTTTALAIDFKVQWNTASASNSIQLLGGWIIIDG
jgi:hypothetical protein